MSRHGYYRRINPPVLRHEYRGTSWEVDPQGAFLVRAEDATGPLITRKQEVAGKVRGGLFVTLPQFGPDERLGRRNLAQHGFGRTALWGISRIADESALFRLSRKSGEYSGLHSTLTYRFNRSPNSYTSIYAAVTVFNDSDRTLRVAPGLHPYIDLSRLNADEIEEIQRELLQAQTVPVKQASLKVGPDLEFMIETKGFEKMTWWSDGTTPSICVEPSLAGASFSSNPRDALEIEMLRPGESRVLEANLTWRAPKPKNFLRNQRSLKS